MRFSFAALVASAFAAGSLGAPMNPAEQSLVSQVGALVAELQGNMGVDTVEQELRGLFGEPLDLVENALGDVSLASKLADLLLAGVPISAIQVVAEALAMLEQGLNIEIINIYLSVATGGLLTDLGETLGINDIVALLGGMA